jgi:hypothetical protein
MLRSPGVLEIAYALQENLEREAEITGTQSIFQIMEIIEVDDCYYRA